MKRRTWSQPGSPDPAPYIGWVTRCLFPEAKRRREEAERRRHRKQLLLEALRKCREKLLWTTCYFSDTVPILVFSVGDIFYIGGRACRVTAVYPGHTEYICLTTSGRGRLPVQALGP